MQCWGFSDDLTDNVLFKKIGIVVDPLHFDVWTNFSSSTLVGMFDDCISFGALFVIVETFPPLLIRLLFGPTMFEKSTRGCCVPFIIQFCRVPGMVLLVMSVFFFTLLSDYG